MNIKILKCLILHFNIKNNMFINTLRIEKEVNHSKREGGSTLPRKKIPYIPSIKRNLMRTNYIF